MINVKIRAYAELNDFLPADRRQVAFTRYIRYPTSVKDLLEGAGIPHPEIVAVLVDDEPVDFDLLIERGCRVAAYPHFRSLVLPEALASQSDREADRGFVVDVHLGKLARHLRLLGFDTLYDNFAGDDSLVHTAIQGGRYLLTRDRELLMRAAVTRGYFIRSDDPWQQLIEVVTRFGLAGMERPFTRCLNCNGVLRPVDKADIEARLEPNTRRYFNQFWQCRACGNVYWKGSHFQRLEALVDSVRSASRG